MLDCIKMFDFNVNLLELLCNKHVTNRIFEDLVTPFGNCHLRP